MSTKRQQIMDAIQDRFAGISQWAGYSSDLGDNVFQWRTGPLADNELPAVCFKDKLNARENGGAIGCFRWRLTIEVFVMVKTGETTPSEVRLLLADCYKAIGNDVTWGGLAHDTEQPSDEMLVGQSGDIIGTVSFKFDIIYDAPKWEL